MLATYRALLARWTVVGWRRVRVLDHGHTGGVFKVRKVGSRVTGALKALRGEATPERIAAFREEAAFAASDRLAGYKPKCLAARIAEDEIWFVMARVGRFPKNLVLRLLVRHVSRIAEALEALHALGFIHCDVKPANMGIDRGRAVLLDFGCLQSFEKAATNPSFVGTKDYIAPEVRRGEPFDGRADTYSLGKTLETFCRDRRYLRIFLPVIARATAESPANRYRTMAEFRRALEECERNYLRDMAVASRLVKFSRVVRWGGVALISVVSIFLVIVAISKRKFQDEVIRSNEVSIRILAEKKLGRIARANGELGKAKQHFQNAADLGDEHSRKILRLMSQCEK